LDISGIVNFSIVITILIHRKFKYLYVIGERGQDGATGLPGAPGISGRPGDKGLIAFVNYFY